MKSYRFILHTVYESTQHCTNLKGKLESFWEAEPVVSFGKTGLDIQGRLI